MTTFAVTLNQHLFFGKECSQSVYAYEVLINDLQICDKAYFDAALEDMCSRFLTIPEEEIKGMLNALGVQYPAALVNYFERFIDEMRKFCQE